MIPNFHTVSFDDFIYRGGQPDVEGFSYLQELGVKQVVKLNMDHEGCDDAALGMGMELTKNPISLAQQVFLEPDVAALRSVVAFIKPGCFIHCTHGQDRTGLVIALYRLSQGWSKADAEKEMLDMGFHKALFGLWECWEHWQ